MVLQKQLAYLVVWKHVVMTSCVVQMCLLPWGQLCFKAP